MVNLTTSVHHTQFTAAKFRLVNYDEVTAPFFEYVDAGVVPPPTVDASPARRLRDAFEPIAMHPVWSRLVNERLAALGLDFFTSYVWSRASALGEPDPGVVVSAFAVFEPTMISTIYEQARATVGRDELIATRTTAATESLTQILEGVDLDAVAEVADILQVAASTADGTGRPLYSGFATRPWPTDPVGRLWHSCELLREHRGDSNVAVSVAHGLDPIEMNILTELYVGMPLFSYTATRGWSPEAMEATAARLQEAGVMFEARLTEGGREMRQRIEDDTDAIEQSIVDTIGADLDRVVDQLNDWSQLCLDAGAFPPDPCKRAAG